MPRQVRIALVGDFDPTVTAHQAIPLAIDRAARASALDVHAEWVGTDAITSEETLAGFDGIWCVPASPYRSMEGALRAIRRARTGGIPFLGTCGGFQHAIVEYARNVLGWHDADHAETAEGGRLVIAPLACALVESRGAVSFAEGSRLRAAYGAPSAVEGYRCRYGLNPEMQDALVSGPLRVAATDENGEIRAVELDGHPFFVATLFQPERTALDGATPPIVRAFVDALRERIRMVERLAAPQHGPILSACGGAFSAAYVQLSPFVEPSHPDYHSFDRFATGAVQRERALSRPLSWERMRKECGFASLAEVNLALRTSILGLRPEFAREDLAARLEEALSRLGVDVPTEGWHSAHLHDETLDLFTELGHDRIWVSDELLGDPRLAGVNDLRASGEIVCSHLTSAWAPDASLLWTVHWDSHCALLYTSHSLARELRLEERFEGFFCTPETDVYWSL